MLRYGERMTAPIPAAAQPSLVPLLVVSFVLLPIGVAITGFTLLSDSFYSHPPIGITLLGYAIGFIVAATAPVWLLARSVRQQRRFGASGMRTAGIACGVALSATALVITGLPVAATLVELGTTTVQQLSPLSEQSSSYSVADLRDEAADFLERSTSGLPDLSSPMTGTTVYAGECTLSNLSEGRMLSSWGELYFTSADEADAIEAVADEWRDLGFAVTETTSGYQLTGEGWLDSASVAWKDDEIDYNVMIIFTSVCVDD
jgi:hypothetical protein